MLTIQGRGVTSRLVAWPEQDVFAIEIDDQRAEPQPLSIRMLRHLSQYAGNLETLVKERIVVVRTRNHTAASQLHIRGDRIVLTQEFREGAHVAKSAVAARVVGRASKPRFASETEVRLTAPAAKGRTTLLLASAATLAANEDVAAAVS